MHIKNFIVKKTHMNTAPKKPYTVQSPEMIIFMYQHNYTNFDIFSRNGDIFDNTPTCISCFKYVRFLILFCKVDNPDDITIQFLND